MAFRLRRGIVATAGPPPKWDLQAILVNARTLQSLGLDGEANTLLDGKHVALLRGTEDSRDAKLFLDAARGLGARVAEIRTEFWNELPQEQIHRLAAILGHLYAAVECQGMRPDMVRTIETRACVPVYDHIASPDHPVQRIAEQLGGNAPLDDRRRLVLQAVLIGSIANH
jgi:ornithine carbamoyltransferase